MANPEHVEIVKQGAEAITEWRKANPEAHLNLRVANLIGANLRVANLIGANLIGANLIGANLSGADLFRADLIGANLSGADLSGANLSVANLSVANLREANLSGAKLSGANLSGANLSGAKLSGANLSGANLSGAKLSGANLSGANLSGAKLSGAKLSGACLDNAVLSASVTFDLSSGPILNTQTLRIKYPKRIKTVRGDAVAAFFVRAHERGAAPTAAQRTPPLTLLIEPGTATPEEIGELLADISHLYRLLTGDGITFTATDAHAMAEAEVYV